MICQYPFRGRNRVTCEYGKPGSWAAGWHIGTDIVCDNDKTIYPIAAGVVESINAHGSAYGNHVCVKHEDGNVSLYAHLDSVAVKVGQAVALNTLLGVMGATGNVTGPHLHLELHQGAYRYPRGYAPKMAPWLVDPLVWIEDHILREDWQDVAIREVCQRYDLDHEQWAGRKGEAVTVGMLFGVLNKIV